MTDLEQTRLYAIVEIGGEIGDLVGKVDQLRLQRRPLVEQILSQFRMLFDVVVTRVFDDAFANTERQIKSAVRGVTLFKVLDDAKGMEVMVEAPPMTSEATIQRSLPRVSEGWMTDVVNQCKRLREIFVQAKSGCSGPGDLRDLNRMGQTAAKMIGRPARKDLGLPRQPAKGAGLHDALTITLEGRARGARGAG